MGRLKAELAREFPGVPRERVEHVVDATYERTRERARFETFVPLLVQRAARDALSRETVSEPFSTERELLRACSELRVQTHLL